MNVQKSFEKREIEKHTSTIERLAGWRLSRYSIIWNHKMMTKELAGLQYRNVVERGRVQTTAMWPVVIGSLIEGISPADS